MATRTVTASFLMKFLSLRNLYSGLVLVMLIAGTNCFLVDFLVLGLLG